MKAVLKGEYISISASEPIEKMNVVSFSGQTVKTYNPAGKTAFRIAAAGLPKEKLVFVLQSANGKATVDMNL